MRILLGSLLLLTGCVTTRQPDPSPSVSHENKEKDTYIKKVEEVVSDSASALTAVAPVLAKGTVREVVETQLIRLSGVSKPSVEKVKVYERILKDNDAKALQKEKEEAKKVEKETDDLLAIVQMRDIQIEEAETRADAEFKQRILWQYSTYGMWLFIAGTLAIAFTPFKKSGATVCAGGMLAMASAWIFDTAWFIWIVGGVIGVTALCVVYAIIKGKDKNATEQSEANPEHQQK